MKPAVSVVMTSYNHEKYLSQAIESVLAQTHTDLELIVVDDASRDASRDIIRRYEKADRRVRSILHDRNVGIARTTNDGFDAAGGEYTAYAQSDDLWVPHKLASQLEILQGDKDLVVWSDALIIDGAGNPTGQRFTEMKKAVNKPKSGKLFSSLAESNYICGQSMLLRTAVVKEVQFDPRLAYTNDYKFMLELSRTFEFFFIEEPLVQYRIHGDNSISSNRPVWLRDNYRISRFLLKSHAAELPKEALARCHDRIGAYLLERGHARYARKCYRAAIASHPRKTSYYKKYLKTLLRG